MRVALHASKSLLATLHDKTLRVFDLASGTPREVASLPVANGHALVAGEAFVAVLTGKVSPAQASVRGAKLARYSWALEPIGECELGEVARYDLSVTADGARAVTTDWKACRVTVFDAATGARLGAAGVGIPSGASFSPRGDQVIAGSADQGSGDILLFGFTGEKLSMETLPAPRSTVGLDDAPYFTAWSRSGALAAVSNESWGGRGVFVYDIHRKAPAWAAELPGSSEESEEWFAFAVAFVEDDRVLLVGGPGALHAYAAADGRPLGSVAVAGDGRGGFVVDETRWLAWTPGATPTSFALPDAWRHGESIEAPTTKKKAVKE